MTLDELRRKGYRIRIGYGSWTLFYGEAWMSRTVASGKLNFHVDIEVPDAFEHADKKAMKEAIGAACADLVKRRVEGQKV